MTPQELRDRILETVGKNGGHLASSLGAVEIAVALAEVFEPTKDRIVWDVGHQAYAWKLLTGRDGRFETLRKFGGVAPFPNPAESAADAAVAGHAGVALSVAEGLAAARDRRGSDEQVVAVIGDAAIANGVSFEAINNCATACRKVIVVLNDNEMSISRPTGSLAKLFGRLITNVRYNRVKSAAENAGHRLRLTFLRGVYHRLESRIKGLFLGNRFFEQFGLRYIGPVDGHDLAALKAAFTVAKEDKRSVLVHVVTRKGKGYPPAEVDPTKWHGVGPFDASAGTLPVDKTRSWSAAFGDAVTDLARRDPRVVALTAGMKDGTGLRDFASEFPERFFDVGIAEEHLVAFAAGLAAGGLRPVVAVYSTFLQRAVDQMLHDVCLAKLPVVFCVDRAGVVGADGMTHQGIYDIVLLKPLPNLTICQPRDETDFRSLMDEALARPGPTVIRYPRGAVPGAGCLVPGAWCLESGASRARLSAPIPNSKHPAPGTKHQAHSTQHPAPSTQHQVPSTKIAVWATGDQLAKAEAVADTIGAEVVFARYLKPFDAELLARQRAAGMKIVSIENGAVTGGFGESIGADLRFGWPDEPIPHGTVAELEKCHRFDAESIISAIRQAFKL